MAISAGPKPERRHRIEIPCKTQTPHSEFRWIRQIEDANYSRRPDVRTVVALAPASGVPGGHEAFAIQLGMASFAGLPGVPGQTVAAGSPRQQESLESKRRRVGSKIDRPSLGPSIGPNGNGHPRSARGSGSGSAAGSETKCRSHGRRQPKDRQTPLIALPLVPDSDSAQITASSASTSERSGGCETGSTRPRGVARSGKMAFDRQWEHKVASAEQQARAWAALRPPAWAIALGQGVGSKLHSRRLRVGTDCEGMGAPVEALRILISLGILGAFVHCMSGEIDDVARRWFLSNHRWPELLFGDMLERVWPDGVADDLLSCSSQVLPFGLDLYICGFPCCPFSMRKGSSACFEEDKARPFFAVIDFIMHRRPKAFILENVPGLEGRMVAANTLATFPGEQITCLEFVLRTLRKNCPGYWICVCVQVR